MRKSIICWILVLGCLSACQKKDKDNVQRDEITNNKTVKIVSEPVKVVTPASQTKVPTTDGAIIIFMGPDARMTALVSTDSLPSKEVSLDSIHGGLSPFQVLIKDLKTAFPQKDIQIKADQHTSYTLFKKLISELHDINITKYKLITTKNDNFGAEKLEIIPKSRLYHKIQK